MSTFSIWYVSAATGQLCPMHHGFTRKQLHEAHNRFRDYALQCWAGADAWILKRGRKTIARRENIRGRA